MSFCYIFDYLLLDYFHSYMPWGSAAQSSISFLDLAFARSSPVNLGGVSPAREQ
jgi:hypothetical protein